MNFKSFAYSPVWPENRTVQAIHGNLCLRNIPVVFSNIRFPKIFSFALDQFGLVKHAILSPLFVLRNM